MPEIWNLSSLIESFRFRRLRDPVLGDLLWHRVGLWEGKRWFAPVGGDVEFTVEAGKEGPGDAHREFYQRLERRYPEVLAAATPLLQREVIQWRDEARSGDPVVFDLEGFGIPDVPRESSWDIMYVVRGGRYFYSVFMDGWVPVSVTVDC
jgi:hypothetical protein